MSILDFKHLKEPQPKTMNVGCGLGFWNVSDIASLFRKASNLPNVWLPKDYWDELYD